MTIKLVLLISGKAGVGKDFISDKIIEYSKNVNPEIKILKIAYADLLKFYLLKYFNWDGQKNLEGRKLLQHIGTDVIRKKYKNYWVKHVYRTIKALDNFFDMAIVTDCRFYNEINFWKDKNIPIITLRIDGQSTLLDSELKSHSSETELDNYNFDIYYYNHKNNNLILKEFLYDLYFNYISKFLLTKN
ncbi:MAG: hypothetical protein KatS3mg002_1027 [Candidatus Woesearchaeota archaeon]|jgi:hypothetical protein|nr:MAG: hypothetical protein KatS3mg002_1027 [Candidatus Woesearchaeota archaeon]